MKSIYEYYRDEKETLQGAQNVRADILQSSRNINYEAQYQQDEIQPEYRRIIVRHYKLLYTAKQGQIQILRIVNTYRNPEKQIKGND